MPPVSPPILFTYFSRASYMTSRMGLSPPIALNAVPEFGALLAFDTLRSREVGLPQKSKLSVANLSCAFR